MLGRFLKTRTLRTEILVLFLFLISVSSAVTIVYSYFRDSKSHRFIYEETIKWVNAYITSQIVCLTKNLELAPQLAAIFLEEHPEMSIHDSRVMDHFLRFLKFYPHLYSYYYGTPDGSTLVAFNLTLKVKPHLTAPSKPFPPNAAYGVMFINKELNPNEETWIYVDKDLKLLSSEQVPLSYDPRIRPWYQGAEKAKTVYSVDIYNYIPTMDRGIGSSYPVYDSKGQLIAVIGADLSLNDLNQFLLGQKIGKQGAIFILDPSGEIILPISGGEKERAAISHAHELKSDKEFIFKYEGIKYLASFQPFPIALGKVWTIAIIDPLPDLFSSVLRTQQEVILISTGILLLAALVIVFFARHISAPIVVLAKEVNRITHLDLTSENRVDSEIQEIRLIDSAIAALRIALRSFSRYVPKEIARRLTEEGKEIVLGGEKKEVTVLFSDIVEFTKIAESLPIETVTELLAEYFDILSKIVLKYQGNIDKYIGDSIMVLWGAPTEVPDQGGQACMAALECQASLLIFNQKQREKGLPEFHTRIGINTGSAIVGNFGTLERMNYTAVGDLVNTASRLQITNKVYHTKILIGEEVAKQIETRFALRPIDIVEVRGKTKKIKIYELVAALSGPPAILASPKDIELCAAFTKGYEAFHLGEMDRARELFQSLAEKFPADYPTQIYLERLLKP